MFFNLHKEIGLCDNAYLTNQISRRCDVSHTPQKKCGSFLVPVSEQARNSSKVPWTPVDQIRCLQKRSTDHS